MSRTIIAAVLPDKDSAYDVGQALKALSRAENSTFTLYNGVALYQDIKGHLEVLKTHDRPLLGAVSSPAIGGMLGLLAGSDGVASAATLGAFRDAFDDVLDAGVIQHLLSAAGRGKAIVIIDADEATPQAVNALIDTAGGTLLRPSSDR